MACKLPHEELNEIHKMLETKYSGEELEIAKAEAKESTDKFLESASKTRLLEASFAEKSPNWVK
jgi:hypothetical protein